MTATIRQADSQDIEAIKGILTTNGQIADITEADVPDFIVAEVDGVVVGCGRLCDHTDCFEVSKISVLPLHQRRGIGMEIVLTLLGRAKGKRTWLLSVDSHDFWRMFDFEIVAEKDEPEKVKAQCNNCEKRAQCSRVVMRREIV